MADPIDDADDTGLASHISEGVANMPADDVEDPLLEQRRARIKAYFKEFGVSRRFDKPIREKLKRNRAYANGKALESFAVSTNVIGSMIDILVAVLYARNPDVSVKKSPQLDAKGPQEQALDAQGAMMGAPPPTMAAQEQFEREQFAKTLELVLSRLWKKAKLKKRMRRVVRAVLSSGFCWLKAAGLGKAEVNPLILGEVNTLKDNLERVQLLSRTLTQQGAPGAAPLDADQLLVLQSVLETTIVSLQKQTEVFIMESLALDFVKGEDIQVSSEVETIEEYLDSPIMHHIMHFELESAKAKFPDIKDTEWNSARIYYRKEVMPSTASGEEAEMKAAMYGADGEEYALTPDGPNKDNAIKYVRAIEGWDRRDNHIYTGIEGVEDKWAREPYQPPYPASRFYPFFLFMIYPVDDERSPDALSSRLWKLQDEYCSVRSSYRLTRKRSTPAMVFNASQINDVEAKKFSTNAENEYIGIKPTDLNADMRTLMAEKPMPKVDPRLYETQPILNDMERAAGVQEAQQQAITVEKTAREAEIQQQGFAARQGVSRDMIEETLNELAQYTAEVALQCLPTTTVQRMCGNKAYWPEGMDIQDIETMVEVDITAGTTGKPKNQGDREAWATVLPMIQEMQQLIATLRGNPAAAAINAPLISAVEETLRETMRRMGDETDLERFIPQAPMAPIMGAAAAGAPPLATPGAPPNGAAPTPATAGPSGTAAPPASPFPDTGAPVNG